MNTINNIDWSVLELDGVADVMAKAATKVAYEFRGVTEFDDLHQEAAILLASEPEAVRDYVNRHKLGLLHHWLWCRLTNTANQHATTANRTVPYERVRSLAA